MPQMKGFQRNPKFSKKNVKEWETYLHLFRLLCEVDFQNPEKHVSSIYRFTFIVYITFLVIIDKKIILLPTVSNNNGCKGNNNKIITIIIIIFFNYFSNSATTISLTAFFPQKIISAPKTLPFGNLCLLSTCSH